jgi:hypothetical protein
MLNSTLVTRSFLRLRYRFKDRRYSIRYAGDKLLPRGERLG